jgi:hypothetical protein
MQATSRPADDYDTGREPHASSSASCCRCPFDRRSSGPARLPKASSTAASAAAQRGVRSPSSFPGAAEGQLQPHLPVIKAVIITVGRG